MRVRVTKRQRWMEKGERMCAGESHGPLYLVRVSECVCVMAALPPPEGLLTRALVGGLTHRPSSRTETPLLKEPLT